MIKRRYFFSAGLHHRGDREPFMQNQQIVEKRSWSPDPEAVIQNCCKSVVDENGKRPDDTVIVTSFNKI